MRSLNTENATGPTHRVGPSRVPVQIRLVHEAAQIPTYAKPGDAGADLSAVASVTLAPGERALVPTGVSIALPDGYVGLVHPRSGLAHKHGISIVNAPGTIDAGYRGEILVNLINLDPRAAYTVNVGDRIAQLVIQEVAVADFEAVDSLSDSVRGETGHGSSGGFAEAAHTTEHRKK